MNLSCVLTIVNHQLVAAARQVLPATLGATQSLVFCPKTLQYVDH